jgi:dihydroorotate dehydrogenase (fumarate)
VTTTSGKPAEDEEKQMVDLSTRYLGLNLHSPIVASASPLNGKPDTARQVEDAGAAALVLPSLFEEEILHRTAGLAAGPAQAFGDAVPAPDVATYAVVGDNYLDRLETIASQSSIPVIASLNAQAPGSWARYARWLVDAGADAVELNLYHVVADPTRSAADLEQADVDAVAAVRAEIDIPLAVKLSPYYSATANFAARVVEAGAQGLVLFNRFYQPDIDLSTLDVIPRLEPSQPWELRLPLRWIAILRPQLGPGVSLAATTGIATGTDVVKALMVGADVAMMTSALLRYGPAHIGNVEAELRAWLDEHGYGSLAEVHGRASHAAVADPSAFERANYVATLRSWRPSASQQPQRAPEGYSPPPNGSAPPSQPYSI